MAEARLRTWGPLALLITLVLAPAAPALDHRNLEGRVPITVEDAYPVKFREPAFESVFFYQRRTGAVNRGGFLPELEYGIARDWQLSLGSRIFGQSHGASEGSGNLELSLLRNLNTETLRLPAFAVKAGAEFPTGIAARGVDFTVKGIMTRTIHYDRVHFNAGYTRAGSLEGARRRNRWEGVLGWDRAVGLQSLLVADVVVRQSERKGNPAATVLEVALRRQVSPRRVVSFGVGVGVSGKAERQPVYLSVAVSQGL